VPSFPSSEQNHRLGRRCYSSGGDSCPEGAPMSPLQPPWPPILGGDKEMGDTPKPSAGKSPCTSVVIPAEAGIQSWAVPASLASHTLIRAVSGSVFNPPWLLLLGGKRAIHESPLQGHPEITSRRCLPAPPLSFPRNLSSCKRGAGIQRRAAGQPTLRLW
jgi:hypothetical protein